jgi:hypothetical protein
MPLEIVTLLAVLAMFAAEVRWLARCLWHRIPTIPIAAAAVSSALTKSYSWPRLGLGGRLGPRITELQSIIAGLGMILNSLLLFCWRNWPHANRVYLACNIDESIRAKAEFSSIPTINPRKIICVAACLPVACA